MIYKANIRFVFLLEYLLEYLRQRLITIRSAEVMLLVELKDRVEAVALLDGMSIPPLRSLCVWLKANGLVLFWLPLRNSENRGLLYLKRYFLNPSGDVSERFTARPAL